MVLMAYRVKVTVMATGEFFPHSLLGTGQTCIGPDLAVLATEVALARMELH